MISVSFGTLRHISRYTRLFHDSLLRRFQNQLRRCELVIGPCLEIRNVASSLGLEVGGRDTRRIRSLRGGIIQAETRGRCLARIGILDVRSPRRRSCHGFNGKRIRRPFPLLSNHRDAEGRLHRFRSFLRRVLLVVAHAQWHADVGQTILSDQSGRERSVQHLRHVYLLGFRRFVQVRNQVSRVSPPRQHLRPLTRFRRTLLVRIQGRSEREGRSEHLRGHEFP